MRLYEEHIRKSKVYIMEGKKVHCFYPDEIMYLQSNKHYIEFYMGDGGRFLIRGKMDDMERALKGYGYIRIHASYLVNVKYSNFAHRFCLCTLKIQYLAVIQLSKVCCYAA